MALLDHVAKHVEVRVVGHAGLADPAHRGAHGRLRAVDRLALAEVELVARAAPGGALLAAELDPLRVLGALADVDHQAHLAAVIVEGRVHPRVALALPGQAFVAADEQRRVGIELDPVDRREQRDDREGVRDEVRDHADVRGRADQGLLLQDLDLDLLDAVQEVAQGALLGEQHLRAAAPRA